MRRTVSEHILGGGHRAQTLKREHISGLGCAEQGPRSCAACPQRCTCQGQLGSGLVTQDSGSHAEALCALGHGYSWKRFERASSTLDSHSCCVTGHCSRFLCVIFQNSRHPPIFKLDLNIFIISVNSCTGCNF